MCICIIATGNTAVESMDVDAIRAGLGSKSKHMEMETYETNPDFARVSFLRNTRSAALGVSGFEKRDIRVPRAVSPAIRLDISFPSSGMWGVTGETGRRREQAKY